MAAIVLSKQHYRSKNCFNFGNANVSSFVIREYGAEVVETSRKEKRN